MASRDLLQALVKGYFRVLFFYCATCFSGKNTKFNKKGKNRKAEKYKFNPQRKKMQSDSISNQRRSAEQEMKMKKRGRESKNNEAAKKHCQEVFRCADLTDNERKVLHVLADLSRNLDLTDIENWDRKACAQVFECICALQHGLLLWPQIPHDSLKKHGVTRYGDRGIDAASVDLATCLQAKFYAPGAFVSWRSVSTFFTYAAGVLDCKKLILAVSEKVKVASEVKLIKNPAFVEFHTLSNETIAHHIKRAKAFAIANSEDLPSPAVITQLRPHQEAALGKIVPWLAERDDAKFFRYSSFCGTGKTVVYAKICEIMRREKKGVVAILVPSVNLLLQTRKELLRWLPDLRIGLVGGQYEISSNVEVVVCIYNSVKKIRNVEFALVIVDEAHHVDGMEIEEEEESMDEKEEEKENQDKTNDDKSDEELEESEEIKEDAKENKNEDEEEQWEKNDVEEKSMDEKDDEKENDWTDEKKAGHGREEEITNEDKIDDDQKVVHRRQRVFATNIFALKTKKFLLGSATLAEPLDFLYSMPEAIRDKVICDYTLCIPVFEPGTGSHDLGLVKLIHNHVEWQGILAYLNSRAEAKEFRQLLLNNGITALYMDGSTLETGRAEILKEFKNGKSRVLVTVNVLNEGVDIPECNTALFVRPRNSRINVTQIIGRILRLCEALGKSLAFVVLPGTDEAQELTRFLRLISDVDSRIKSAVMDRSYDRIEFIYPPDSIEAFETQNRELAREVILNHLGRALTPSPFLYVYNIIREEMENGATLPKLRMVWQGVKVGRWLYLQKLKYGKNQLKLEEAKLLEDLPGFTAWKTKKELCDWKIRLYREYSEVYGHAPQTTTIYKGFKLGQWITHQRMIKDKMGEQRRAELEALMYWCWDPKQAKWQEMLDLYVAHYKEHAKLAGSTGKLCVWLRTQRYELLTKNLKTPLHLARKAALDSRLPHWADSYDDNWKRNCAELKKFVEVHKDRPTKETARQLTSWLRTQWRNRENLSNERKALLTEAYPHWQRYTNTIKKVKYKQR